MNKIFKKENLKILKYVVAVIFAFYISSYMKMTHTTIANILILAFSVILIKYNENRELKYKISFLFSFIFSFIFLLGRNLFEYNNIFIPLNGIIDFLEFSVTLGSFTYIIGIILNLIYTFLEENYNRQDEESITKNSKLIKSKYFIFIMWAIVFLSWVPCLLAFYPGIFSYDMNVQHGYVEHGITEYSKYHPPIHTFCWDLCYRLEGFLGLKAITIYAIIQMIIFSYVLSKLICFILKRTDKKWLRIVSVAFFTLNPVIPIVSILMIKDVIFSALMCLITIDLYEMLENVR